jgi:hypothetical protein
MYFEKGHAKEVTAKVMRAHTEVSTIVSRNASKSYISIGRSVSLPKGITLKESL